MYVYIFDIIYLQKVYSHNNGTGTGRNPPTTKNKQKIQKNNYSYCCYKKKISHIAMGWVAPGFSTVKWE